MGFLCSLLMMCGWMIYGGANYYMTACNVTMDNGGFISVRGYCTFAESAHFKSFYSSRQRRSIQQYDCHWFMQSMDWLDAVQRNFAFRLGMLADNLPDISNRVARNDDQRAYESRPISTFPGHWRQKSIQPRPDKKRCRFSRMQLLRFGYANTNRLDDLL